MDITLHLDEKTKQALQQYLGKHQSWNDEAAVAEYFVKKSLQDAGLLENEPGVGTKPEKLNSSNDD
ncbi:hypothetical protein [Bartonella sp. LJL80]